MATAGVVRLAASAGSWQPFGHGARSQPIPRSPLPAEVIQHAVWLYHCFSLSLRDVETILAARGVVVSYETIREWGLRFGRQFANELKRCRPRPGDKWHLDEVFIRVDGKQHYLWRRMAPARHPRPKPAQHEGGQAVLPQAAPWLAIRAEGNRNGQAQELRRREAHDPAPCRAPAKQVPEQPDRGVASADATTRAADAAVQVSTSRPAFLVHPRPHPQPLPAQPSPPHRR